MPALPPFPGHVSLLDAVRTIGARVDALQLRHADLFRRIYALPDMIQRTFVRVPLDIVRHNVVSLRWQPMMLSQLRCGSKLEHLKLIHTIRHVQQATRHDLPLCVDMKIHYELLKYLYGQSYTSCDFQLHWPSLPLIYVVWHPYKHMITMLYRNFMPIICLIERVHTDFKEGGAVPTKVKLLHMEKTILALCLNAGTFLPRVQAKLDAFAVAAQNGPLNDMQSKSKELLLGLKVLLKEYPPPTFSIGVLVRDCNWAGRDPGSGKNALAVLEWRNFATFEIFVVFNIVFCTFWFETRNFASFWVLCVLSLFPTGYCYSAATCTTDVLFIFLCDPDSHDFACYILLRLP